MAYSKKPKILVADDCQTNLVLLKSQLFSMDIDSILTQNPLDVLELAKANQPDLILLDVMMPNLNGFELCDLLKKDLETKDIPIIFVSAKNQCDDKISGFEHGAVDYITKPYNKMELRSRINVHLKIIELQKQMLMMANTDKLTKLPNRRYILDVLTREVQRARKTSESLTVLMLDIDHFKKINDSYGHLEGDNALVHISGILKENLYALDSIGRYGGEEFIIVMPDTPPENAYSAAEKIRKCIEYSDFRINGNRVLLTSSIGVATSNTASEGELIKQADQALYSAKYGGRNRTMIWSPCESVYSDIDQDSRYEFLQNEIHKLTEATKAHTIKTVSAFMRTMAVRDPYVEQHSRNCQYYSCLIAEEMGLSKSLHDQLETAALLHDLGMLGIPEKILLKPEKLSLKEKKLIEQHPIISGDILEPLGVFEKELPIIRQHHERLDGSGYPTGLMDREICIGAKILAVADIFDAMTSARPRPYSTAMDFDSARQELLSLSGIKFDSGILKAFIKALDRLEGNSKAEYEVLSRL